MALLQTIEVVRGMAIVKHWSDPKRWGLLISTKILFRNSLWEFQLSTECSLTYTNQPAWELSPRRPGIDAANIIQSEAPWVKVARDSI
jgi:hypothetical protein